MMRVILGLLFLLAPVLYATESITNVSDSEIMGILGNNSPPKTTPNTTQAINQKTASSTVANVKQDASMVKVSAIAPASNLNTSIINTKSPNVTNIDNSSDDILQKKRQLETEKLNAEIKKARMGDQNTAQNDTQKSIKETAQTIVTGVAIDSDGRKIAWLQFADGGSLTVNIGSKVGDYLVSNISMSNVTLTRKVGKKTSNVVLKRSYVAMDKNNNRVNSLPVFNPSPVVTGANVSSSNSFEVVPPIIK